MKMHILSGGRLRMRKSIYLPDADRIEVSGATVICGHDDAQWATLRKGADAYD